VAIIEDRPPIMRAALMAAIYLLARTLFRRVALLNAVSLAAVVILLFRPSEITQASFQLSFLAAGIIAGIAEPLLERTVEPYSRALEHLNDLTRDGSHPPKAAEFRIDLRSASNWLGSRVPSKLAQYCDQIVVIPCRISLRLWELAVLSIALQIGMLSLMARDFHRVSFIAPVANIPAVLLTSIVVPFGFASLVLGAMWRTVGMVFGRALSFLIAMLIASTHWFAQLPSSSLRVPSPPTALFIGFFVVALFFSAAILSHRKWSSRIGLAIALVFAALIVAYPFRPRLQRGRLEVTV
jgi:competence protein ComEC